MSTTSIELYIEVVRDIRLLKSFEKKASSKYIKNLYKKMIDTFETEKKKLLQLSEVKRFVKDNS